MDICTRSLDGKKLVLFSGGCSYEPFAALFDQEALAKTFSESVGEQPAIFTVKHTVEVSSA
jgi:hypothetical protein